MDDVVSLIDVRASYEGERHAALAGVTLSVAPREQIGITGPNGAGKTTILEVIDGLLPIASGTVRVFGQEMTAASHRLRSRIAYVPQNLFFPTDTPFLVRDVVFAARFGRTSTRKLLAASERRCVEDALAAVGILDLKGKAVGRLSGGQQRKSLLARALAQQAELLLLDEPTANLDPEAKEDVAALVAFVRRELGATSVVVSHETGPLLDASDRTVAVAAGRIVADVRLGARISALSH